MLNRFKRFSYFPFALYFAFFAKIFLLRWKPKIIVVTGSSGKTTLLHIIASQLKEKAIYTYHANSSYGIPFHLLGINRETLRFTEWPKIILLAPFRIFRKTPEQKLYIVEADCDRPNEGKFLGNLLKPDITLWISLARTHSMNFENLVRGNQKVEEVIAKEFGQIALQTKELVIANGDSKYILENVQRLSVKVVKVSKNDHVIKYKVGLNGTEFVIDDNLYKFKYLLPQVSFYQILMTKTVVEHLGFEFDTKFKDFGLPPGRSSVFKGIKDITIVDSSYNANLDSMKAILSLFAKIDVKNKWIVLGDMLEQGENEKREHELLAEEVNKYNFEKLVLMGPRVTKYTKPRLRKDSSAFDGPDEVSDFLRNSITGGEVILFKGARFLEGVIEKLLLNKDDAKNLVRRELVWQKRRARFGL